MVGVIPVNHVVGAEPVAEVYPLIPASVPATVVHEVAAGVLK